MVFSKIAFFSSSVTCLITLPGEPITSELSGISLFSVIKLFAPMIQFRYPDYEFRNIETPKYLIEVANWP